MTSCNFSYCIVLLFLFIECLRLFLLSLLSVCEVAAVLLLPFSLFLKELLVALFVNRNFRGGENVVACVHDGRRHLYSNLSEKNNCQLFQARALTGRAVLPECEP